MEGYSLSVQPNGTATAASATWFPLNLLALAGGLCALAAAITRWPGDGFVAAMVACSVVIIIIAAGEAWLLRGRLRPTTALRPDPLRKSDASAAALRFAGLLATLGLIGLAYWLFPEYHGSFYAPFWRFLSWVGAPVLCLAPFYFLWTGRHQTQEEDIYLQLGRYLTRLGDATLDGPALRAHLMGWAVKAFFLPLMVVYLVQEVDAVTRAWQLISLDTMRLYKFFYELSFLIDLLFCVVGYTMTLRVLDSHIRSTEPTAFGWVVALVCYQPFYSIIGSTYLKYEGETFWDSWLSGYPLLRGVWAAMIIVLVMTYSLSTVAFGLRFSNLTHRGIITCGPYRYTKHPAYLTKNASWWLISVPFVSHQGWAEALRHCGLLLLLNLVYFLRAKTEEWHLSRDADYVAYSAWIAQNGLFRHWRRLGRQVG